MKVPKKIKLYTNDDHFVTELSVEKNLGIYHMMERGTLPNIIMWGERFFIKGVNNNYSEEFCMAVF